LEVKIGKRADIRVRVHVKCLVLLFFFYLNQNLKAATNLLKLSYFTEAV